MIHVSVQPGQEVLETLTASLREQGVTNGAIVSLIGAVEGCAISTMATDDYAKDIVTEYEAPAELTGTGEIKDGAVQAVHIHVTPGLQDESKTGYLHRADACTSLSTPTFSRYKLHIGQEQALTWLIRAAINVRLRPAGVLLLRN